ncbi:MAG: hypothetical protein AABX51_07220 [Nanoarchaeota archaeon]
MVNSGWTRGIAILVLLLVIPLSIAQNSTNQSSVNTTVSLPSSKTIPSKELAALSQNCINTYECREFSEGQHYYGCYFDSKATDCRCYTGNIDLCKNKDLRCAFEFECQKSEKVEGYNYDCTYNKADEKCQCFTGEFSECRYEISNKKIVVKPSPVVEPQPPAEPELVPINVTVKPVPPKEINPAFTAVGIFFTIILIIVIVLLYALNRQTYDNLMRKARNAHKKAEHAHENGNEQDAKEYLAEAEQLRKKALKIKKRQA